MELLIEMALFAILVVLAVWLTLWQLAGQGVVWYLRRRADRAWSKAETVQPTHNHFEWFERRS